MAPVLGFVGLGQMGSRMAARLVRAGYRVIGYDMDAAVVKQLAADGLEAASSLGDLGAASDIVLTSLPNGAILRDALFKDGVFARSHRVSTIIDLSTIGPRAATALAADLQQRHVNWVEAPVSGGPKGAEKGSLAIMLACSLVAREIAEPILKHLGRLFYIGHGAGLAQTAKLANNMLSTAALVMTSEAMVMGAKAGLDPTVLLEIINAGSGRNSATVDKFPRSVVPRGFDYGFFTELAYKDVRLCVDEAENLGVPMIIGSQIRQMMAATNAKYGPKSDFTEVVRIYEEWADVTVGS